jgi:hypothetical protein
VRGAWGKDGTPAADEVWAAAEKQLGAEGTQRKPFGEGAPLALVCSQSPSPLI